VGLGARDPKGKAKRLVPFNDHVHSRLRKVCDERFPETLWRLRILNRVTLESVSRASGPYLNRG